MATAFTLARILSNVPLSRGGPTSVVIFDIHALQVGRPLAIELSRASAVIGTYYAWNVVGRLAQRPQLCSYGGCVMGCSQGGRLLHIGWKFAANLVAPLTFEQQRAASRPEVCKLLLKHAAHYTKHACQVGKPMHRILSCSVEYQHGWAVNMLDL